MCGSPVGRLQCRRPSRPARERTSVRVGDESKRHKRAHRVALCDETLPLGDGLRHLVLASLPNGLEHVRVLGRLVGDVDAEVLVNALVESVDSLAQVLSANVGGYSTER